MFKILYIGNSKLNTTSSHRAQALARLGCNVTIEDPYLAMGEKLNNRFLGIFHYRTGYEFLQNNLKTWVNSIMQKSSNTDFDLIWVNSGELLGASCLEVLRRSGKKVVLYNNDDPTGGRDGMRFKSLLKAIPFYDLCAVVREQNIGEFRSVGAKDVIRVYMSYDEINHKPLDSTDIISDEFRSEIAFVGTWMPKEHRDSFLLFLINQGVPVSIWGARWNKSKYWEQIRPHYRGNALAGKDYVAAVQGAKICIGMLSKGNRDLHTTRSMEIPFIGSLLCAEKTSEHIDLYEDGVEAVFWTNMEECAELCKSLLINEEKREKIRAAGSRRVRINKSGNEDTCAAILEALNIGFKRPSVDLRS